MTEKEQQGRDHVAAWRASGLTQRRYCEQHHYSRSALGYWSWKINHEKKDRGFVEVASGGSRPAGCSAPAVELYVGERYLLRITEGFSSATVKRLLDVIEQR